jgi:hypothetical protein
MAHARSIVVARGIISGNKEHLRGRRELRRERHNDRCGD